MDSGPVATFQVHEYLRPKLCDGLRVATGSYRFAFIQNSLFRVFGCAPGSTELATLEASKNPIRRQVQTPTRPSRPLCSITRVVRRAYTCTMHNDDQEMAVTDPRGCKPIIVPRWEGGVKTVSSNLFY